MFRVFLIVLSTLVAMVFDSHRANAQDVSYQQVIAEPDNFVLNLAYARQKIRQGELQQAAAALERILLRKPNWDVVRLYYGIVLYRLSDYRGAVRELEILEGRALSAAQESDRARYLGLARSRGRGFRIKGRVSVGVRADTNPSRASDQIIANSGTNAFTNIGKETELGFGLSNQTTLEKDIDNGRGDFLFATSTGVLTDFLESSRADYTGNQVLAGGKFHFQKGSLKPYALIGVAALRYETFRIDYGGGATLNFVISPKLEVSADFRGVYENYRSTSFSTVGDQRDGWNIIGTGALTWKMSDTQIFSLAYGHSQKDASNPGFSFTRNRVDVASRSLFAEGRFFAVMAGVSWSDYKSADNFYTTSFARSDTDYYVRALAGAALSTVAERFDIALPDFLATTIAQVGVSWSRRISNVNSLNTRNLSAEIMFTKRFEF